MERIVDQIKDKLQELESRSDELQREVRHIEDASLDPREYKRIQDDLNEVNRKLSELLSMVERAVRKIVV